MNLKSLLTTVMVVGAAGYAYAFPEISTYPTPESTVPDASTLASMQLLSSESFSIVENAATKPYMDNLETGAIASCTAFYDEVFYGDILHKLEFDASEFTANGEWTLTIPAGCLKDSEGNFNEELTFTYTLDDPNVGLGDFGTIELLSTNPANGALLPSFGGNLTKIMFTTSDDAKVNYIDWAFYDITEGDQDPFRIWVRSGSENRYDTNRTFGDSSDQWADGLFISVGGDAKMIEGHTYRLYLTFAGIGYDPETNQYPTPIQISKSTMLSTYIDFEGQTPATKYSPYTVDPENGVMPDPFGYEIDNADLAIFTVTYTGPVKPESFTYSLGQGAGVASAGTFVAENEEEGANGYASVWTFTFDKSIISGVTGDIDVTIKAKDSDGLYVKGNTGSDFDDFEYHITWICNLGADKIISVEPENLATVNSITSITVACEGNKEINLANLTIERPFINSQGRATYIDLDEPEFNEEHTQATWTLAEPITVSGTYGLTIPAQYFIFGDQSMTTVNNATSFTYFVEGEDEPIQDEVTEDFIPTASIEENGNYTTLGEIVLTFNSLAFTDFDWDTFAPIAKGTLYRAVVTNARAYDYEVVEEIDPIADDDFSPRVYTYTFSTPLTEAGAYRFVIAAHIFNDQTYEDTKYDENHVGKVSPELVYNFTIGDITGVEDIVAENGVATVYDIAGRVVLRDANADQIKALAAGVYIINGKKYVVK